VLALAGFVVLAFVYEREPFVSVDSELSEWVYEDMGRWGVWIARPFSWLGGWIGLTILGIVAVVILVRERAIHDLVFFLVAYLGSQVAVAVLKASFDRVRPEIGATTSVPESASFPSGHATSGIASLGALAVLASERLESHRARVWLWVLVVVAGLAVGLSRVALNVHFLTDVLAGWCLGLAWLAGCLLVRERFRRPG
jgi:undecaprenyl-diphosphatase